MILIVVPKCVLVVEALKMTRTTRNIGNTRQRRAHTMTGNLCETSTSFDVLEKGEEPSSIIYLYDSLILIKTHNK